MIAGNHAIGRSGGGAVWCTGAANTTVSSCEFDGNYATDGSGSGGNGGALSNNGTLSVINSTFNGNSSGVGGAVYTLATLSVINSTFTGNSALQGGALYLQPTTGTVTNCTVVGNNATTLGGGICFFGTGTITFNNNIVSANHAGSASNEDDIQTTVAYGSHNLIGASEQAPGGAGVYVNGVNGNLVGVTDPKLAPIAPAYGAATSVMLPLSGSPVIDAGSNALAVDSIGNPLTTDQIGNSRIANGTVDIGAVEYTILPTLDTITGTAGVDQIAFSLDPDFVHIDWSLNGVPSGQMAINDPNGLTINGNGYATYITLDYTNGNPLPNKLTLNGIFTLNGLATTGNPLANTNIDMKTSTVFITYSGAATDPMSLIQGYLKNGFNNGNWAGTSANGVIRSSNAALDPNNVSIGYADSADSGNPAGIAAPNTIELRYTEVGDTNLNGTVEINDYNAVVRNFGTGTKWDQGTVTYGATVSINDYNAVVRHFGLSAASPAAVPSATPAVTGSATTTTPSTQSTVTTSDATFSASLVTSTASQPKKVKAKPKSHR